MRRANLEPGEDFANALRQEKERIREHRGPLCRLTEVGLYSAQLKRYFDLFDRDQFKVYLYEDLVANPVGLLRESFRFLRVDDTFVPDLSARYNVSGIPRSERLQKLFFRGPNSVLSRLWQNTRARNVLALSAATVMARAA